MKNLHLPILEQGAFLTGYLHSIYPEDMPDAVRRPCVLICPGGAYEFVSVREEDPPAMFFFSRGYHVFLLHYSVAPHSAGFQPLRELSAATETLRLHAKEWGILPDQIAVLGFSAGGHLAGSLAVHWNCPQLQKEFPEGRNRPNAAVLCYPVITAGEFAHRASIVNVSGSQEPGEAWDFWSLEKHVSPDTPPTFLWHTVTDAGVPVENSLLFAAALQKARVPFECHLFAEGIHGLSTCSREVGTPNPGCRPWLELCVKWLNHLFSFEE